MGQAGSSEQMEVFDLYDRDRRPTGETLRRGDQVPQGRYHLVIHICLFNWAGQMLIQQRQPFKDGWPNLWDVTVGGSALAGETSRQAARREILEELGLELDLAHCAPSLTSWFQGGFDDIYLLELEPDLNQLILQPEEVQAVEWADQEEICRRIDQGTFIPYRKELIALLFAMRSRGGAIDLEQWNKD